MIAAKLSTEAASGSCARRLSGSWLLCIHARQVLAASHGSFAYEWAAFTCMQVAKAIHTTVRRREDLSTQPSLGMRAAAVNIALLLKHHLEAASGGGGFAQSSEGTLEPGHDVHATAHECDLTCTCRAHGARSIGHGSACHGCRGLSLAFYMAICVAACILCSQKSLPTSLNIGAA